MERDDETGFIYIGARYYCPWLARWLAVDPINNEWYNLTHGNPGRNTERQFVELTASSYEYCYANPVRFTDLSGEQATPEQNVAPRSWTDDLGQKYSMNEEGVASVSGGTITGAKKQPTFATSGGASPIEYQNLSLVPNTTGPPNPPGKAGKLTELAVNTLVLTGRSGTGANPWILLGAIGLYGVGVAIDSWRQADEDVDTKPVALTYDLSQPEEDNKGTTIYRSMKADGGFPLIEESARGLGVRPNGDIPVVGGYVANLTGGMSVAPETPANLPIHRKPPSMGGTGKDPVFEFNTKNLPPGLQYVQDKADHGTIQPAFPMSYESYKTLLSLTKISWKQYGK